MRWLIWVLLSLWVVEGAWGAGEPVVKPARERIPRDIYVLLDDSRSIVGKSENLTRSHRQLADMVQELLGYPGEGADPHPFIEPEDRVYVYRFQDLVSGRILGDTGDDPVGGVWRDALARYRGMTKGESTTDFAELIAKLRGLLDTPQDERRAKVVLIASDFIHDGASDACKAGEEEARRRQAAMAEAVRGLGRGTIHYRGVEATLPLPVGLIYIHTDQPYLSLTNAPENVKRETDRFNSCFQQLVQERTLLSAFEEQFSFKAIEFGEASRDIPRFAGQLARRLERAIDLPLEIEAPPRLIEGTDEKGRVRIELPLYNPSLVSNAVWQVGVRVGDTDAKADVAYYDGKGGVSPTGKGVPVEGGGRLRLELTLLSEVWRQAQRAGRLRVVVTDLSPLPSIVSAPLELELKTPSVEHATLVGENGEVSVAVALHNPNPWPVLVGRFSLVASRHGAECVAKAHPVDAELAAMAGRVMTVRAASVTSVCPGADRWAVVEERALAGGAVQRTALDWVQNSLEARLSLAPPDGGRYPVDLLLVNHGSLRQQLTGYRFAGSTPSPAPLPFPDDGWVAPDPDKPLHVRWLLDPPVARRLFSPDGFRLELDYRFPPADPDGGPKMVVFEPPGSPPAWSAAVADPPWRLDLDPVRLRVEVAHDGSYPADLPPIVALGVGAEEPPVPLERVGGEVRILPGERSTIELVIPPSRLSLPRFGGSFRIGPEAYCVGERAASRALSCRVEPPPRNRLAIVGPMRMLLEEGRLVLRLKVGSDDPYRNRVTSVEIKGLSDWLPLQRRDGGEWPVLTHGDTGEVDLLLPQPLFDQPLWDRKELPVRIFDESGQAVEGQVALPQFEGWQVENARRPTDQRLDLDAENETFVVRLTNPDPVTRVASGIRLLGEGGELLAEYSFPSPVTLRGGESREHCSVEVRDAEQWSRIWARGKVEVEVISGEGTPQRYREVPTIRTRDHVSLAFGGAELRPDGKGGALLRLGVEVDPGETGHAEVDLRYRIGEAQPALIRGLDFTAQRPRTTVDLPFPFALEAPLSRFSNTSIDLSIPRLAVSAKATLDQLMAFPPSFLSSWAARILALVLFLLHVVAWLRCRDDRGVPPWLVHAPFVSPGALLTALPLAGLLLYALLPVQVPPEWLHPLLVVFSVALFLGAWRVVFFAADAFLFRFLARHGQGAVESMAASHVGILLAGSLVVGVSVGVAAYLSLDADPTLQQLSSRIP